MSSMYEKPCKEIFRLKRMLEKTEIPFVWIEHFGYDKRLLVEWPDLLEHYHICYPAQGDGQRISVVEGLGTHGREQDRLEIMGGLTPWEQFHHGDSPIGFLTAENVFKRIKKDWEDHKERLGSKMKVIKVIDEDTLEMKDMVIEDGEEVVTGTLSEEEAEAIADLYRQALPCERDDFAQRYKKYKDAKAEFDAVFDAFKVNLIELHKVKPDLPKSVIIGGVKVTYVSPSTRTSIDSKKLKEEEPELAKKFTKTSNVSASVRLEEV